MGREGWGQGGREGWAQVGNWGRGAFHDVTFKRINVHTKMSLIDKFHIEIV